MAARLEPFWTESGKAEHDRYMRLWAEYRERARKNEFRFGNVHLDYNATLAESGMPRDHREKRITHGS